MKQVLFNNKGFSKAIKLKRKALKISLRDIQDLDVSIATISRIENENTPDLITYAKICKWLGEPLDKFFKK
jgi:transcriptional regulator with XRE-family HTH domain